MIFKFRPPVYSQPSMVPISQKIAKLRQNSSVSNNHISPQKSINIIPKVVSPPPITPQQRLNIASSQRSVPQQVFKF